MSESINRLEKTFNDKRRILKNNRLAVDISIVLNEIVAYD